MESNKKNRLSFFSLFGSAEHRNDVEITAKRATLGAKLVELEREEVAGAAQPQRPTSRGTAHISWDRHRAAQSQQNGELEEEVNQLVRCLFTLITGRYNDQRWPALESNEVLFKLSGGTWEQIWPRSEADWRLVRTAIVNPAATDRQCVDVFIKVGMCGWGPEKDDFGTGCV